VDSNIDVPGDRTPILSFSAYGITVLLQLKSNPDGSLASGFHMHFARKSLY